MKMLLAAVMLALLAGCAVYLHDYPHHRGDGWYSQQGDEDED